MLTVRLFASLRETLGSAELTLDRRDLAGGRDEASVADLIDYLGRERGNDWARHLGAPTVLVAVNQVMSDRDAPLRDGDEVAFLPPVSGG